ncbi:hypothetical protein [Pantoea piersonii]|uniref:hypothetical protein n=1 Tax=Pantoea piersonii TaxID=2364647 RepID=UPI00289B9642|nr:hypothetical protein [Pantoea piersonii]
MRKFLLLLLLPFTSFAASDAGQPFMNCGDGDYILYYPKDDRSFIQVNGYQPLNQTIKYLGEQGDSSAMLVSMPFSRDMMLQWEKMPKRQRLYIYDYPDGVHPRMVEKIDCKWIKNSK